MGLGGVLNYFLRWESLNILIDEKESVAKKKIIIRLWSLGNQWAEVPEK